MLYIQWTIQWLGWHPGFCQLVFYQQLHHAHQELPDFVLIDEPHLGVVLKCTSCNSGWRIQPLTKIFSVWGIDGFYI